MLTIRDAQMQAMAKALPGTRMVLPCKATWIEVHLVDADKRSVPGQSYRIQLPDSSITQGVLDEQGKVRIEGIMPGQCLVCFPEIDATEWQRV
jgi:hypothetical protein